MRTKKRLGAATPKALKKNNSPLFYSANHHDLQQYRALYLARRHRLAPAWAGVVAEIHFGEVRS